MKIEIKELTKKYGSVTALDTVSLCLEDGIYGILGPNGSGKTTLINLLTDTVKRTHGEILIGGRDILSLGAEYRDMVGYMPQQQAVYNDFSAFMYLRYMCSLKGIKHSEGLITDMLKKVNLYGERHKKAGSFSGGMKQRLMLAQALLNDPKILILDEPTAGLDPKVLLKKGRVIKKDTPENLMQSVAGKVFEVRGEKRELLALQQTAGLGNILHDQNGISLRIVTDEPQKDFIPVSSNISLEDVYLYYFEYQK